MGALGVCEALEVLFETIALRDVGYLGAQQITLRGVYPDYPFAPHRRHFESDRTFWQVERQVQTVIAVAEAFVDNHRGDDHRESAGAEIARLAHEDQRLEWFAGVGVKQREVSQQFDFALHLEPAHFPAFD